MLDFENAAPGEFDSAFYAGAGATITAPAVDFCGGSEFASAAAPLDCGFVIQPGHASQRSLQIIPGGVLEVRFAAKQASVSMWVGVARASVTIEALDRRARRQRRVSFGQPVAPSGPFGRPAVVQAPLGRAEIGSVRVYTGECLGCGDTMTVDDITLQPGRLARHGDHRRPRRALAHARRELHLPRQPARHRLRLLARRRRSVPCRPPFALVRAGRRRAHADGGDARPLRHARRDARDLELDRRPQPGRTPSPPAPDGDGDGVADARDNCAAAGNPSQTDQDSDGVGDACETAPSGATTPVTGERVVVEVHQRRGLHQAARDAPASRRRRSRASCP